MKLKVYSFIGFSYVGRVGLLEYRELKNFGDLLEKGIGNMERVLARVFMKWNGELEEPPRTLKLVLLLGLG